MSGNRKKELQKGVGTRTATKPQDPAELEEKQHNANLANAGVIVRHALNTVKTMGVDKSLIAILKTVRHWPSSIDKTAPQAFVPPFSATEISAEEVTQDDDTITSVSFSYSGEKYDFVYRIRNGSSDDDTFGSITLHENGDWVIRMDIVINQSHDHFMFQELNAFRIGVWIENMVSIESEIEQHHEYLENKVD